MNAQVGVRFLRVVLAVLTVWCLGCDAFDQFLEAARPPTVAAVHEGTAVATVSATESGVEAHHVCQCIHGHASEFWFTPEIVDAAPDLPEYAHDVSALLDAPRDPPLRPPLA